MIFPPTNKQFPSIPGNQFEKFAIHFLLTRFIFLSRRFLPIFTSCFTYIQNGTGVVHNLVETKVRKELFCYVCPYSVHVWMLGKNTDIHLLKRRVSMRKCRYTAYKVISFIFRERRKNSWNSWVHDTPTHTHRVKTGQEQGGNESNYDAKLYGVCVCGTDVSSRFSYKGQNIGKHDKIRSWKASFVLHSLY